MVNHKGTRMDKIDMDIKYSNKRKKISAKLFKMCNLRQLLQIFAAFSASWTHFMFIVGSLLSAPLHLDERE